MDAENARRARRTTLALVLAPALIISLTIGVLVIGVGSTPPACQDDAGGVAVDVDLASVPKGPIAGYSHEQLVNAAHIMLAAKQLNLTVRDQRIGIMTAMGESSLLVLNHGDKAGPDSRGLFQQRSNGAWGSLSDRMNPSISATNFFKAAMRVEGRATLEPTLVAHRTQGNANPYHYRPFWEPAGAVLQAVAGVRPAAGSSGSTGEPAGQTNSHRKYALGKVKPITATVANTLGPRFGIRTIGGYRAGNSRDPQGHPSGLALDLMTNDIPNGTATGQRMADYIVEHHEQLGVKYLIWRQQVWSAQRSDEGWRGMADRGSPTQNHMDHVHLSLQADAAVDPTATPACEGLTSTGEVSSTGWAKPSDGPLGSPYGWRIHPIKHTRRFHYGQDMGPGCDAPIWAANKGTVITSGRAGGFGHLIEIDHGGGVVSRYGHMYADGLLVHVGDHVKAGQQIAKMGSDGLSTGCHLHFEVRINGSNVDPIAYLTKANVRL